MTTLDCSKNCQRTHNVGMNRTARKDPPAMLLVRTRRTGYRLDELLAHTSGRRKLQNQCWAIFVDGASKEEAGQVLVSGSMTNRRRRCPRQDRTGKPP